MPAHGGDPVPVFAVLLHVAAQVHHAQHGDDDEKRQRGGAAAKEDELVAPEHLPGVGGARDQSFFAKDFFHEQIAEEVGALALPDLAFAKLVHGYAHDVGQFLVQRRAFAHGGGEVNAPEEERLGRPFTGKEDRLEVTAQSRSQQRQAVRQGIQGIHLIDAPDILVLGFRHRIAEQAHAAAAQPLDHAVEMLVQQRGLERLIERTRVGPAHDLMLLLRIVQAVEEFAESIHLVAFRHDDEHWKPHVEHALDDVQLLGDAPGLAGDVLGGVLDQRIRRDHQEKSVHRTVRAVPLEQGEELLPLAGLAGLDLLEHEPAGGVEQHGGVREPPVHVDGATNPLELVLHAGRKPDVAVADGFGFTGTRLPDDHVPRQGVQVLAPGSILADALLELLAHVVQARSLPRVADAADG